MNFSKWGAKFKPPLPTLGKMIFFAEFWVGLFLRLFAEFRRINTKKIGKKPFPARFENSNFSCATP